MRICIISMNNLFLCPYINKYIASIGQSVDKDLIIWDRHDAKEDIVGFDNVFKWSFRMDERDNKAKKIVKFIKFNNFCSRIIKKQRYDKIIFLHNYSAILMINLLLRRYKNKYIVDIRDYSFENNFIFYHLQKKIIENSGMCVISSAAYKKFLPNYNYVLCHNDPNINKELIEKVRNRSRKDSDPIQISFIGLVRFIEQNKKIIDIFGNDKRFVLAFYGQNSEVLKEYAHQKDIKNVIFKGRFEPSETSNFYLSTDVINNYYGNQSPSLIYALSNKLYYAAIFHMPIMVCKNTYMEEITRQYLFGIKIDEINKECVDRFYEEYCAINTAEMARGCDLFMKQVENDNNLFKKELNKFLKNRG